MNQKAGKKYVEIAFLWIFSVCVCVCMCVCVSQIHYQGHDHYFIIESAPVIESMLRMNAN